MRALTVLPGVPNSARLDDVSEPSTADGDVLVETLAIGICGTDREIAAGEYGRAPAGQERLIIGHESLGRILDAPRGAQLQPGDLVAGADRAIGRLAGAAARLRAPHSRSRRGGPKAGARPQTRGHLSSR